MLYNNYVQLFEDTQHVNDIEKLSTFIKQYQKAVIYFHEDLDGVSSGIAMRDFLQHQGLQIIDAMPIQYGKDASVVGIRRNPDILNVMVDFAKQKINSRIWVDHHLHSDDELKNKDMYHVDLTGAKSAAEKINTYITQLDPKKGFSPLDIEMISMIDSASYKNYDWRPEEIAQVIYDTRYEDNPEKQKQFQAITTNGILNVYKNKKDFLSDMVMEAPSSLAGMYDYAYKWAWKVIPTRFKAQLKQAEEQGIKLYSDEFYDAFGYVFPTPEYAQSKRDKRNINDDTVFKGGYDRYMGFEEGNDYIMKIFKGIGMIQVSKNPFKNVEKNINLEDEIGKIITDLKPEMSELISLYDLKAFVEKTGKEKENDYLQQWIDDYKKTGDEDSKQTVINTALDLSSGDMERANKRLSQLGVNIKENDIVDVKKTRSFHPDNFNSIKDKLKRGWDRNLNKFFIIEQIIKDINRDRLILKFNRDSSRRGTILNEKQIRYVLALLRELNKATDKQQMFDDRYKFLMEIDAYPLDKMGMTGSDIIAYHPNKMIEMGILRDKNNKPITDINVYKYVYNVFNEGQIQKQEKMAGKVDKFQRSTQFLKQVFIDKYYWIKFSIGGHPDIYNIPNLDLYGYGNNKIYKLISNRIEKMLNNNGVDYKYSDLEQIRKAQREQDKNSSNGEKNDTL